MVDGPAVCEALRLAGRALTAAVGEDPLRLDLPPDDLDVESFPPDVAALFGSLYLAAEVDQTGLLLVAEALADRRATLNLDDAGALALERFHLARRGWYDAAARDALWSRLFGIGPAASGGDGAANTSFEPLMASLCDAVVVADVQPWARGRRLSDALRSAAGRLRANLAPRRFGNTVFAARNVGEELRGAIDLLGRPSVGALFGVQGVWAVVRAAFADQPPDIGRLVDRARHGQVVLRALGALLDTVAPERPLVVAAAGWLDASGFSEARAGRGGDGR